MCLPYLNAAIQDEGNIIEHGGERGGNGITDYIDSARLWKKIVLCKEMTTLDKQLSISSKG